MYLINTIPEISEEDLDIESRSASNLSQATKSFQKFKFGTQKKKSLSLGMSNV